ncbi:MAG: protein phosphatase 2C domain-containing protein [Clostridiales bacterium]|nr:protein phosphatase 2C domain-containing protein [Clostridiales bacterium]
MCAAKIRGGMENNMFQGIYSTVIGDSHIRKGVVCQDSSGVYVCDAFGIAVVADGHGSAKHFHSDVGSRIAVKITLGLLKNYMNRQDFRRQFQTHPDFILQQMEKQILMKWREAVQEYHRENPLTEEEQQKQRETGANMGSICIPVIYGSTVLAAVIADGFSFGMILGDGGFVVLDRNGDLFIPVEDKNSHANYTSSLCNTDAIHFFEHWYTEENPVALFVSTDGLYKSFASEEDFLKYHALLAHMLTDPARTKKSLKRNFEKRTREGSGDDISIAMVYAL